MAIDDKLLKEKKSRMLKIREQMISLKELFDKIPEIDCFSS